MVEFGLKLDDNKVSEWSEFYLDYDKLKAVLKKAKASKKKYDDQAKKRPEDASKILTAHQLGNKEHVTITPSGSTANLASLGHKALSREDTMESTFGGDDDALPTISESTSLLSTSPSHSGLQQYASPSQPKELDKNTIFSHRALTDIQDYFGSRYERTMRGYLKEIDERADEFAELLSEEQKKVVQFYHDKLSELEKRFSLLIESVASSAMFRRSIYATDEEDITRNAKNLLLAGHHRRTASDMTPRQRLDFLISKIQAKLQDSKPQQEKKKRDPAHTKLTNEDSDDEGDDGVKDEKALAEADSIKRALIDQYRTAKLLQNYAILNYTGFVKIIKKHDKTIPDRKGSFKSMLLPENLFHEGQAVEKLAAQYEAYYATWFCEGDIRAAHAQMLPKRGDGLEMDWSQLRLGYRMGMCAVLALWVCWDSVWGLVADGNSTIGGRSAFPVFRACGGILLLQWFWGTSVFIWTRYRINYIYLFDFNPKIVATPLGIFEEAVDNTLVFMMLMLLYYKVCFTLCGL